MMQVSEQVRRENQLNLARVHLSFTQQLKTSTYVCEKEDEGEMEKEFICLKAISITTQDSRPKFHFLKRPRICWPHVFHYI